MITTQIIILELHPTLKQFGKILEYIILKAIKEKVKTGREQAMNTS